MDLLAWILRPSGPTHGVPLFLFSESSKHGIHNTKSRQQPLSAWQAISGLENSNLPIFDKVIGVLCLV
jgi:hypothetical protein